MKLLAGHNLLPLKLERYVSRLTVPRACLPSSISCSNCATIVTSSDVVSRHHYATETTGLAESSAPAATSADDVWKRRYAEENKKSALPAASPSSDPPDRNSDPALPKFQLAILQREREVLASQIERDLDVCSSNAYPLLYRLFRRPPSGSSRACIKSLSSCPPFQPLSASSRRQSPVSSKLSKRQSTSLTGATSISNALQDGHLSSLPFSTHLSCSHRSFSLFCTGLIHNLH